MTHGSLAEKTNLRSKENGDSNCLSTVENGLSVAPPSYGVDVIDRKPADTGRPVIQRQIKDKEQRYNLGTYFQIGLEKLGFRKILPHHTDFMKIVLEESSSVSEAKKRIDIQIVVLREKAASKSILKIASSKDFGHILELTQMGKKKLDMLKKLEQQSVNENDNNVEKKLIDKHLDSPYLQSFLETCTYVAEWTRAFYEKEFGLTKIAEKKPNSLNDLMSLFKESTGKILVYEAHIDLVGGYPRNNHHWTIVQTPEDGFRIFQGFVNAYSITDWLSPKVESNDKSSLVNIKNVAKEIQESSEDILSLDEIGLDDDLNDENVVSVATNILNESSAAWGRSQLIAGSNFRNKYLTALSKVITGVAPDAATGLFGATISKYDQAKLTIDVYSVAND